MGIPISTHTQAQKQQKQAHTHTHALTHWIQGFIATGVLHTHELDSSFYFQIIFLSFEIAPSQQVLHNGDGDDDGQETLFFF